MKRKNFLIGIFITQIIVYTLINYSYALDTITHENLNRYIANNTIDGFSLDLYLRDQLGLQSGREEIVNSKEVWWWLKKGGKYEDIPPGSIIPYLRSFHHFHNPLTNEGLKGTWESSIQWSQEPQGTQSPQGHYSWHDVRGYFYDALIATDQTTRDRYFADTFRGLGQLMHLVQDLSVPEHARDDAHILYSYETWVKRNVEYNDIYSYKPFISFNKSVIGNVNSQASVPVANLFDTDQYVAANPDPSLTLKTDIGLSEYTNANFLSPDTMFTSEFPYPKAENCVIILDTPPNGTPDLNRKYLSSTNGHPGEQINHLAVVSYLNYFRKVHFPNISNEQLPVSLNPTCYQDYADKLIPRAIGYSAELLDYFFRGSIEISLPDKGTYAFIDDPDQDSFSSITLRAQNTSPEGEEMSDGSIVLVIKYKVALNDPFHNYSYPVPTTSEFSYIVVPEANNVRSIPRNSPSELTFDLTNNPLPLWATDVYLQVVYKGQLGSEAEGISVGFKDISEPTPVDIINSMDKICLYDNWYDAGSPEAIALVDTNNNGIADTDEWDVYSHDIENIYFTFLPTNDQHYPSCTEDDIYIQNIPGGDYHRMFILSDYDYCYSFCAVSVVHTNPYDPWGFTYFPPSIYCSNGIKNQTELADPEVCLSYGVNPPCYIRYYPTFTTIRGIDNWTGINYQNSAFPQDSSCDIESLN